MTVISCPAWHQAGEISPPTSGGIAQVRWGGRGHGHVVALVEILPYSLSSARVRIPFRECPPSVHQTFPSDRHDRPS